jgi:ribosome-associated heat shock protein Hsp15
MTVRMDKWLWAARFFKTRTLAARACELGRIQANGQRAKAAREVRIADMLRVTNDGGDFQVEVLLLSEVRGPASVAQTLYRETEASQEMRLKVAAERKAMMQFEQLPAGRPSLENYQIPGQSLRLDATSSVAVELFELASSKLGQAR